MKEYNVFIETFSVAIKEAVIELKDYDFKAKVDGEEYRYKVINHKDYGRLKKEAFGRASVEIMYHAKNQGNIVRFEPVGKVNHTKKKKVSKDQLSMFEDKHEYN